MCGVEVSDNNCISNQHKELIAVTQYTSLFIDSEGEVKIWGRDNYSQLSGLPVMDNIVDIAGGYNHLLAVDNQGNVFGWGRDNYGQSTIPESLSDVIDLSGGYYHSLGLKSDGTVVGWG